MPNSKNTEIVKNLKEKTAKAKSVIFTEYAELSVNQMSKLRERIKDTDSELVVAKNTLLNIALKDSPHANAADKETLKGPVATIFSYEDSLAPIKTLAEFIKEFKLPIIKGGILEGKETSAEQITLLSKLPGKEQLVAQIIGNLKSPLSGIVNVLKGSQRKLVYALSAIVDKKSEGGVKA